MTKDELLRLRVPLLIVGIIVLLAGVIAYYELVKRGQWEAAARTDISREATKEAEKQFKAKEKEFIDQLLDLKEESHRQKRDYEASLQNYRRENARLKSEIERVKEEGRKNEELLARLHGYALYERVLARTDELWNKYRFRDIDQDH